MMHLEAIVERNTNATDRSSRLKEYTVEGEKVMAVSWDEAVYLQRLGRKAKD